jgi:signal transduction histidine kinase
MPDCGSSFVRGSPQNADFERKMSSLEGRVAQRGGGGQARMEAERHEAAETELLNLLRRTVTEQEAERQRIARELHDTLGQFLTLLRLGLDGIGESAGASPDIQAMLGGLKNLATETGREVCRLAWDIRPAALDLGIEPAIRSLVERWGESSTLRFDLHLRLGQQRLPVEIESTLYRLVQEALTNVARHAQAARVGIVLTCIRGQVSLVVEDDGKGFAGHGTKAATCDGQHMGLLGMQERVSLVGGTLDIESAPGHGTTLFVRIPM